MLGNLMLQWSSTRQVKGSMVGRAAWFQLQHGLLGRTSGSMARLWGRSYSYRGDLEFIQVNSVGRRGVWRRRPH